MQLTKTAFLRTETGKIVCSASLVLGSFLIVLLFFGIKFEVNDDAIMSNIASGALGGHTERLIYVNIIIGYILQFFYGISGAFNWYAVFQLMGVIICFITLCYIAIDKLSLFYGLIVSAIFMVLIGTDILMWFQFSKNATVLTVTGIVLVRLAFDGAFNKKALFFTIAGAILMIFGALLRFESFIATGAISIPFIFLKLEKSKIIKCLAVFATIVLCTVGFETFNTYSYLSDEEWSEYYIYNETREEISDYKITFTNAQDAEQYGLTANEYTLIYNWNYYDPEVFTLERLNEIEEKMPTQGITEIIIGTAYKSIHFLYETPPFLLLGFILLAFLFFGDYKKSLHFLLTFVMLGLLLVYLVYLSRLPHRVEMLLVFSTAVFALLCFPFKASFRPTKAACSFALCAVVLLSSGYLEQQQQILSDREGRELNMSYFDALSADKENLYLLDTSLLDVMMGYDVFATKPDDYFSNIVFLGSWHSRSPISDDKLEYYGYTNPYRAILGENCYLACNNYSSQLTHLQQHYSPDAYITEVPEKFAPTFGVFKVETAQ